MKLMIEIDDLAKTQEKIKEQLFQGTWAHLITIENDLLNEVKHLTYAWPLCIFTYCIFFFLLFFNFTLSK